MSFQGSPLFIHLVEIGIIKHPAPYEYVSRIIASVAWFMLAVALYSELYYFERLGQWISRFSFFWTFGNNYFAPTFLSFFFLPILLCKYALQFVGQPKRPWAICHDLSITFTYIWQSLPCNSVLLPCPISRER